MPCSSLGAIECLLSVPHQSTLVLLVTNAECRADKKPLLFCTPFVLYSGLRTSSNMPGTVLPPAPRWIPAPPTKADCGYTKVKHTFSVFSFYVHSGVRGPTHH